MEKGVWFVHRLTLQEVRNMVGNIPLEWYDDQPHLGYDLDGRSITKPARRDEVSHTPSPAANEGVWSVGGVPGEDGGSVLLEDGEGEVDRERGSADRAADEAGTETTAITLPRGGL